MFRKLLIPLTLALLMTTVAGPSSAGGSAGNGIVMMVHAHFEPWVDGPPPALEALAATPDEDYYVFHTITYSATADTTPVVVGDPLLLVTLANGAIYDVQPNRVSADAEICQEETNLPGHEGPIEACNVFALPVSAFDSNLVTLRLVFTGGEEDYNVVAHYLLHSWMESGGNSPVDLETVDNTFTDPTPMALVPSL